MAEGVPHGDERSMRFGYFVLQAQTELGQDGVHVLLEDLGTGEKLTFDSTDELGRYLARWASSVSPP